jgi:hypothetical protein
VVRKYGTDGSGHECSGRESRGWQNSGCRSSEIGVVGLKSFEIEGVYEHPACGQPRVVMGDCLEGVIHVYATIVRR